MLAPTFAFTIPSLQDETSLDCRIYHPNSPLSSSTAAARKWRQRGAIIAHPYTSLGGSYDDCVVLSAVEEIVKLGAVVGTFNFRGAGSSQGRASWTGKSELSDYISFVSFFIHYLEGIKPPIPIELSPVPWQDTETLSPIQSDQFSPLNDTRVDSPGAILILGGYSYGSLIATRLPSINVLLERFKNISKGTTEAEIVLRAEVLSLQSNRKAHKQSEVYRGSSHDPHQKLLGSAHDTTISFGGDETEPGSRRSSRESKRSLDIIRKSVDRSRRRLGLGTRSSDFELGCTRYVSHRNIAKPQIYYLMISPLLPPISLFATMFSTIGDYRFFQKSKSSNNEECQSTIEQDGPLATHPTLAIYGDKDFFTSQRRLRRWAEGLSKRSDSLFQFHEIAGAGHFWQEEGVDDQMRGCIRKWMQDIVKN